jgi:hypothetical protein
MFLLFLVGTPLITSAGLPQLGVLDASAYDYIIILPDLHGDTEYLMYSLWLAAKHTNWPDMSYETMESILVSSAEIPAPRSAPERTALVQLGDVTNRGPGGRLCFTILFSIEQLFGWRVVSLFGNHELMSFTGKDGRYVHDHEYVFYKGVKDRAAEFSAGGTLWTNINNNYVMFARIAGESPSVSDSLFVHGGVNLSWLSKLPLEDRTNISELNKLMRWVMADPARADSFLASSDSPLWTRDFLNNSLDPKWCETELVEVLTAFKVSRVFVGHTPLDSKRVEPRCSGKIILTDVTLSRWMGNGGQPIAIVMEASGGPVTAHYFHPLSKQEFSERVVLA